MNIHNCVTYDIEVYPNYFLAMFTMIKTGQTLYFEKFNDSEINLKSIHHILKKYTVITFNGLDYDLPITEAALKGCSNQQLFSINEFIISGRSKAWQTRKQFGLPELKIDHIDIMELLPLKAGLKMYAARRHVKHLEDLPIEPGSIITPEQLPPMREYCGKDNYNTGYIGTDIKEAIELRENLAKLYKTPDIRSKSDAQLSEQIIKTELKNKFNVTLKKTKIPTGKQYFYQPPVNLKFRTPFLRDLLRQYCENPLTIGKDNKLFMYFDNEERSYKFKFGTSTYKLGVGGIHSCEKKTYHIADENTVIKDFDVASFYPNIILNNKLYPAHIGEPFLKIYKSIVERRLKAKAAGDKVINESLKITINGLFGKFGSKYSPVYAPDLLAQVTITGQLSSLMLIEELHLNGIDTISANTDGFVVKYSKDKEADVERITKAWQAITGYDLEGTEYAALYSRDVNNYIAVKPNGEAKAKGTYLGNNTHFNPYMKNPENDICRAAIMEWILNKTPLEDTIKACRDLTQFLTVRTVQGGATQNGNLLGKVVRWYYGAYELDNIRYKKNNNKVPKSDGAVPVMDLPESLPDDIDYQWYIDEAKSMISDLGLKAFNT